MITAKSEILGRIRRGLGIQAANRTAEQAAIERKYVQTSALNEAQRLDLFAERLRDYDVRVYRCRESDLAAGIAQALTARHKHRLLVPEGIPSPWLPESFEFVRDRGLAYGEVDRSEGVLTGCLLAMASTGTIVLRHSPQDGRRALTLIPDYHLCVVHGGQVVHTVPEGVRKIRKFGKILITTISGPSATSDIEMTRIKGVHGPRTLDVILVVE